MKRVLKVLTALLVSMTAGALVLMAMGSNRPSAGPFCLSSYHHLDSVEEAISSRTAQSPSRWNSIEIYYSGTKTGNIKQLASLGGFANPDDIDCHFVICNDLGGDGQIQPTEKWQRQWSIIPARKWYGSNQTIRICVIADDKAARPTELQLKRIEALVEGLCGRFDIRTKSIRYPSNWL